MNDIFSKIHNTVDKISSYAPKVPGTLVDLADGFLSASSSTSSTVVGDVLLRLGNYKFSIGTAAHQKMTRKVDYRWAQQDRLTRKPAQQFLGVGAETISLDGYMFPHWAGGYDQVAAMRKEAEVGQPLILVDQFGNIFGLYCITSIEETASVLDHTGRPRRIDFALSLIDYGEDL